MLMALSWGELLNYLVTSKQQQRHNITVTQHNSNTDI